LHETSGDSELTSDSNNAHSANHWAELRKAKIDKFAPPIRSGPTNLLVTKAARQLMFLALAQQTGLRRGEIQLLLSTPLSYLVTVDEG
jgi:hypothetical protein